MISVTPYLVYKGNCEEAFLFYKTVFGGKSLYIGRYKDVPEEAKKFFPNAQDENVMHATLQIDERTVIMGNDRADLSEQSAMSFSSDFYLYVQADNPQEAGRIFHELSVGGKIIMPIVQTFWSPCYGILTDRFGIHWKITSHPNNEE
jgi:PhnB protein